MPQPCPLCRSLDVAFTARNLKRDFFTCAVCDLTFADSSTQLPPAEEKYRYDQHNNDVNDPRYREFVSPIFEIIKETFPAGCQGLDFGAGPGPVLSIMFEEHGFRMKRFDPYYWPDAKALEEKYDFVVTSEVVEHFSHPGREFSQLRRLLKPCGLLSIMTHLKTAETEIGDWYYLRDPTHLCAYSKRTFEWIKAKYQFNDLEIKFPRLVNLRGG